MAFVGGPPRVPFLANVVEASTLFTHLSPHTGYGTMEDDLPPLWLVAAEPRSGTFSFAVIVLPSPLATLAMAPAAGAGPGGIATKLAGQQQPGPGHAGPPRHPKVPACITAA